MKATDKGFTLMEVIVALGIVAVAFAAIVKVAGDSAYHTSYLQQKSFAQWVAMNRMAELQLAGTLPGLIEEKGSEKLMGKEWFWSQKGEDVRVPGVQINNLRKIVIKVFNDESRKEGALATLEMLIGPR